MSKRKTKLEGLIDAALAIRDELDDNIYRVEIREFTGVHLRVCRRIFGKMLRHPEAINYGVDQQWDGKEESIEVEGVTYCCFKPKRLYRRKQ